MFLFFTFLQFDNLSAYCVVISLQDFNGREQVNDQAMSEKLCLIFPTQNSDFQCNPTHLQRGKKIILKSSDNKKDVRDVFGCSLLPSVVVE